MAVEPISDEDLDVIIQHGVFDIDDQRYCLRKEGRALELLPLGHRLLRVSLLMHFCDPNAADRVNSIDSYRQCALAIKQVRIWRASDEAYRARTGQLPEEALQIARAAQAGSMIDLHRATAERLEKCRAGTRKSNIYYFDFKTKQPIPSRD
jgi:hypothetical protein